MNARLQRLRAELAADRTVFEARVAELEELDLSGASDEGARARAALALHHAYGAIESALARIAREVEGSLPEGPDRHQALLASMALEIHGIRPPVLSGESVTRLRRLLAFRHFLRHAYAVALDPERLEALRRDAIALGPLLGADFGRIDAFLSELAEG